MIDLSFVFGEVTLDDLTLLNGIPVKDQCEHFKEDMLQVEYPGGFILDVGWYPSFNSKGCFKIVVVKNYDWDNPVSIRKADTPSELVGEIKESQKLICEEKQSR